MICPQCKALIADTVKSCPYCNYKFQTGQGTVRKKTVLGKVSLLFAGIDIGCIVIFFLLLFSGVTWLSLFFVSLITLLIIICSIIAIVIGAIAYFSSAKDRYGLFGFILGICFLISSFMLAPAATYLYVSGLQPELPETYMTAPVIVFSKNTDQATISVEAVGDAIYWHNLYVSGTYETRPGEKVVEEGDQITGCSGTITIGYAPTGTVIDTFTFN